MSYMNRPGIILLREGTDSSQGKAQLVSNINACQASNISSSWVMLEKIGKMWSMYDEKSLRDLMMFALLRWNICAFF